jgi:hypothetical protein
MMRSLFLAALIFSLAGGARAQAPETSTDPSVTVVKHSWAKERINWEGDPFGAPVENFEDMRRRSVDTRRVERARGSGNMGEAAKVEREMRAEQVMKATPPKAPRYAFVYQASLRNTGTKTIKEIDWDYVFLDAVTGEELGRREFTSVETIAPGKSKQLSFTLNKPPAQRISVYALDSKERQGLVEKIVLSRVQYSDGSVWQRP